MTVAAMKARARVDWFRVLADLQTFAGMGRGQVAKELGMPESNLRALYRGQNRRPLYEEGQAIVALWSARCCRPVSEVHLLRNDITVR